MQEPAAQKRMRTEAEAGQELASKEAVAAARVAEQERLLAGVQQRLAASQQELQRVISEAQLRHAPPAMVDVLHLVTCGCPVGTAPYSVRAERSHPFGRGSLSSGTCTILAKYSARVQLTHSLPKNGVIR